ncbi:MAG: hypothetical protein R6W74_06120, partial [Nitrosomonas halophila]
LESVESYAARADDYFGKYAAKIYAKYQALLHQNNALDFDDLLVKMALLLILIRKTHKPIRISSAIATDDCDSGIEVH